MKYEIVKPGIKFELDNMTYRNYNTYLDCKVVGTDKCYEAKLDLKRKALVFNFKFNNKQMKGIKIPDDLISKLADEEQEVKQARKERINTIINELVNGERKIKFVSTGCDFVEYVPSIENLDKDLNMEEVKILKEAIEKLTGDIVSDPYAYIKERNNAKTEITLTLSQSINAEKVAENVKAKEEKLNSLFEKAKETGVKQEINSWKEECNDKTETCDLDIVTEYAMPDGTIKTEREHTW